MIGSDDSPGTPAPGARLASVFRSRLVMVGGSMLILLLLAALTAPLWVKAGWLPSPTEQFAAGLDEDGMPLGAGGKFLVGTDGLGRDVFSRVLHGTRVSLTVGVAAMLMATLIGVLIGVAAGYRGGTADLLLMRFTEMNMTLPAILLAVALAGVMDGRTVSLLPWHWLDVELKQGMVSIFLIIGLVCWPAMVRMIRAEVMSIKEREFILASRALGASGSRLIFRHILPNIMPTIIVMAVMLTANTILLEAGLGYLGLGVPPPAPTWGSMITDGQPYFIIAPCIVIAPGLAIVLTVLAFNLIGQGLQEVLNPKLKR